MPANNEDAYLVNTKSLGNIETWECHFIAFLDFNVLDTWR